VIRELTAQGLNTLHEGGIVDVWNFVTSALYENE
jgi:hypothetical protein